MPITPDPDRTQGSQTHPKGALTRTVVTASAPAPGCGHDA